MGKYVHVKSGKIVELDDAHFEQIELQGVYARPPEKKAAPAKKKRAAPKE